MHYCDVVGVDNDQAHWCTVAGLAKRLGPEAIADKFGHITDDLRWLAEVSGELEAALA